MELTLDPDHPLAKAIYDTPVHRFEETWLILKTPGLVGTSTYRAHLTSWTRTNDSLLAEFETWEQYMDRRAQAAGL